MTNVFTAGNTVGYTEEELNEMNIAFELISEKRPDLSQKIITHAIELGMSGHCRNADDLVELSDIYREG